MSDIPLIDPETTENDSTKRLRELIAERRMKLVLITPAIIDEWVREGEPSHRFKVLRGVPADAIGGGVAYDPERDCVMVRYYHESFGPVILGDTIPSIAPLIQVTYDQGDQ